MGRTPEISVSSASETHRNLSRGRIDETYRAAALPPLRSTPLFRHRVLFPPIRTVLDGSVLFRV